MSDYFILVIGWVHAIAAVAWLGGAIFYWAIVRPVVRSEGLPNSVMRFIGTEFSQLVMLSMWTLVITGGILMFNRLSGPASTLPYSATLGLKIALSAWMFFLVIARRSRAKTEGRKGRFWNTINALGHIHMTIILGAIVFLLSDILGMLAEGQLGD